MQIRQRRAVDELRAELANAFATAPLSAAAPYGLLILELCRTIDDHADQVAGELSDQWDQLKGIAESSRSIERQLEAIDNRLFELAQTVKQLEK